MYLERSVDAVNLNKILTKEECQKFANISTKVYSNEMVEVESTNYPRGCSIIREGTRFLFYNSDEGSTKECGAINGAHNLDCIEWIDPPVLDCNDEINYRACTCRSYESVNITYDSQIYDICDGETAKVTWNGWHNIQEVNLEGYTQYWSGTTTEKNDYKIGTEIHGFENSGHSEVINGLHASVGQTRYFICTLHVDKKFAVTCSSNTCSGGAFCIDNNCVPVCTDNEEITVTCICNGEEISSGYCHGTYSSDYPICDGDIRPCSCSSGNDCQTGATCDGGTCSYPLCTNNVEITETCSCNDQVISSGYCHGTYTSNYTICQLGVINAPCACSGDYSNGYCYRTYVHPEWHYYHSNYDRCNAGVKPCLCSMNNECAVNEDCSEKNFGGDGKCYLSQCVNNEEITLPCMCNGQNISSGYCHGTYSSDYRFCDGDIRPCSCSSGNDCLTGQICNEGTCSYQECANNVEITETCICNDQEISGGYCHGTYSSDYPTCDGDIRPCSCSSGNDCLTGEFCEDGVCTTATTQTVTVQGEKWTWISIGVTLSDNSIDSIVPTAAAEDKIQSQQDGTATRKDYSQYGGPIMWEGTLKNIPLYEMLKVNFASETTFRFIGIPDTQMTIPTGWKWVGIPVGQDIPIDDFIPGEWEAEDKIQSQEHGTATRKDYSQYGGPIMWEGTLKKIVPGLGYKINKKTSGTFTVR